MSIGTKLGLAGTVVGLFVLAGSRRRDDEDERASVGWAPALDPEQAFEYERMLQAACVPVDLEPFEHEVPMCGFFYQTRKKETWLGDTAQSITYQALYNTVHAVGGESRAVCIASNPLYRLQLHELAVCGSWNDERYGTYATRAGTPVGPHGRGIDLRPCHADNRQRILEGESPARTVDRGRPGDNGSGAAARHGRGRALPYVWLPYLDEDSLLAGRITTRGCSWPDGTSGLEPPPEVRALGGAML